MKLSGHMKRILVAVILVAAVVAVYAAARLRASSGPGADVETAVVKRGDLVIDIETSGKIQAKNSAKINPQPNIWDQQITWVIEEGTEVKKGDDLIKLQSQWLKEQLRSYDLRLEERKARVTDLQEALKIKEAEHDVGLGGARLALELAVTRRRAYGEVVLDEDGFVDEAAYSREDAPAKGEAYQAFRDAELKVREAETQLERATTDFEGMDELLAKGFVTRNDFDEADLKVLEAQRKLESVLLDLRILKNYTHPQKTAELEAQVEKAKDDLQKTEIEARSQLLQAKTDLAAAQVSLRYSQQRYDQLKRGEEGLDIKAPVDGTVLYGDPGQWWMRDRIKVGQRVWSGMRLFTIPDPSKMIVETRVLEMDLYKISEGQEVTVTLEALPGVTFKGSIVDIAQSSRGQNWWLGEKWKYFGVEVELDETDPRLKSGMNCDVQIIADRLADAVYVPIAAVFAEGGRKVCQVAENGGFRSVEVKIGKSTEKCVEILEGLQGGEKVVLGDLALEEEESTPTGNNRGAMGKGPAVGAR